MVGGYSFIDNITAQIAKARRLEATDILDLASASINGNPTLITILDKHPQKGIELRDEMLDIEASSRYEGDISLLPGNGWDEKFNSVDTTLNLPAGWRLFASFGSDNRTTAWLDRWNLMDIFLVLLISIAIYQLYGWRWSIPATLFIVLIWHEPDAPTTIWLFVLMFVALLRLLKQGSLRKFIQFMLIVVVAITLLQVLQFSVYEIRTALYPQLERHSTAIAHDNFAPNAPYPEPYLSDSMEKKVKSVRKKIISKDYYMNQNIAQQSTIIPQKSQNKMMQNRVDPNAVVQTGIGEPKWSWHSYDFSWQSGVGSSDSLELWLISPTVSRVLKIINIIGMLFFIVMFIREFIDAKKLKERLLSKEATQLSLLLCLLVLSPNPLNADIPSPQLLEKFKTKLTKAPICLPQCASINGVDIDISNNQMSITMRISAGDSVAVPIIGNRDIWLPKQVTLDNQKANLHIDGAGELWIWLTKGVHTIHLWGTIEGYEQIMLSPELPLHNVKSVVDSELWSVRSDNKSYIEIVNLDKKMIKAKEKSKIEPLIEVKRTLYFGLRWYIDTEVKLLNQIDKPYSVTYQLLPNESILDKEIELKENRAILHITNKKRSYHWRSSLPITKTLELKASQKYQIVESWQLDISSIWDISYSGIEPIGQLRVDEAIIPRFKPWSNEKLILNFEKAKAVKGETLTIESTTLKIAQSQRYRDITLELNIKSAKAQQYIVVLGNAVELKPTTIDAKTHYLKIDQQKVSIPLQAKSQKVKLSWREEIGSQTQYPFPNINLGKPSVNNNIELTLPDNRWILWTTGPILGPAVLLWGVLLAVLLFAIILGKIEGSPLKTRDWLLLGVGVSTTSIMIMLPIVIWIFVLRFREQKDYALKGWIRNLTQIVLVILTIVALTTIVGSISNGLLNNPDMMIVGNNSYAHYLNWYSDRILDRLPTPTVISLSIWYYRVLMLLWSIWIAFSLIKWLKWAWSVFSKGDMWVKREKKKKDTPKL